VVKINVLSAIASGAKQSTVFTSALCGFALSVPIHSVCRRATMEVAIVLRYMLETVVQRKQVTRGVGSGNKNVFFFCCMSRANCVGHRNFLNTSLMLLKMEAMESSLKNGII
jgi:hypothetical protein